MVGMTQLHCVKVHEFIKTPGKHGGGVDYASTANQSRYHIRAEIRNKSLNKSADDINKYMLCQIHTQLFVHIHALKMIK